MMKAALKRTAHPFTLAAAGLIFLNDFALRPLWPDAWWTGKLSTLAAAFALPILLADLLALLFPRRRTQAAWLSFGLVLAALILLKASPLSNRLLTSWLPLRAVPDPSDLLAIFPWLAGLLFYFRPRTRPASRLRLGLVPFAALFLLADAAAPEIGVACMAVQDDFLLTRAGYGVYMSADGGRSWVITELPHPNECFPGWEEDSDRLAATNELTAPDGTRYRFPPGGPIERSSDGGAWETVYTPLRLSEPEQVYLDRTLPSAHEYVPAPLGAQIDPGGSSLVLAMGLEGVLIVPPSGEPEWAAVGPYQHGSLRAAGLPGYLVVLGGEMWLCGAAALAWMAGRLSRAKRPRWQRVLTILGWLILLAAALAQHPEINTGYLSTLSALSLLLACVWTLALLVIAVAGLRGQDSGSPVRALIFTPLLFAGLLIPYAVWAGGLLPGYTLAMTAAILLAAAVVLFGPRDRKAAQPPARKP